MQLFDRRIEESNLQLWSYFDECIPVTATAQSNPKSICILRTVPWMSSDLRLPFCLALENEKSPWNQKLQSVWVCSVVLFLNPRIEAALRGALEFAIPSCVNMISWYLVSGWRQPHTQCDSKCVDQVLNDAGSFHALQRVFFKGLARWPVR